MTRTVEALDVPFEARATVCHYVADRAERRELYAMLGLDNQPATQKTWDTATGRGIPECFRRQREASRRRR